MRGAHGRRRHVGRGDVARWYSHGSRESTSRETIEAGREGFAALAEVLPALAPRSWREERDAVAAELVEQGVPETGARPRLPAGARARARHRRHRADQRPRASRTSRGRSSGSARALQLDVARARDRAPAGRHAAAALGAAGGARRRARRAAARGRAGARRGAGRGRRGGGRRLPRKREKGVARLAAFTRALAGEGADLAGLTLAVRQLRRAGRLTPWPGPTRSSSTSTACSWTPRRPWD